jgi:hypothetical protein
MKDQYQKIKYILIFLIFLNISYSCVSRKGVYAGAFLMFELPKSMAVKIKENQHNPLIIEGRSWEIDRCSVVIKDEIISCNYQLVIRDSYEARREVPVVTNASLIEALKQQLNINLSSDMILIKHSSFIDE